MEVQIVLSVKIRIAEDRTNINDIVRAIKEIEHKGTCL